MNRCKIELVLKKNGNRLNIGLKKKVFFSEKDSASLDVLALASISSQSSRAYATNPFALVNLAYEQ